MRGRRAIAGLASLVVAAGVLAAVVPGAAGADAPSQQFPPVDQPGVSQDEIRVGGVVSATNNPVGDNSPAFEGVKAYFNMINASKAKGIYGRKLTLVAEHDDHASAPPQAPRRIESFLTLTSGYAGRPPPVPAG